MAFFPVKRGNPKTLPFKKIFVILGTELAIQWDKGGKQIVSKVLGKPGQPSIGLTLSGKIKAYRSVAFFTKNLNKKLVPLQPVCTLVSHMVSI